MGGIDDTDWNTLKAKCADNGCALVLRIETVGSEYRFSLSAVDKLGAIKFDNRANDEGYAPQHVITGLASSALADWWA